MPLSPIIELDLNKCNSSTNLFFNKLVKKIPPDSTKISLIFKLYYLVQMSIEKTFIKKTFDLAFKHYKNGNLKQAEILFKKILKTNCLMIVNQLMEYLNF